MAEPITFYQQWAAAWQQVDKYSTNPWCVDSKNLDIFSDSQAIKWMPWSSKEVYDNSWVDVDSKERFYLASDGRVWDSQEDVWYNHSYFDTYANNINYGTWSYTKAIFWTPKKLLVAYSWDEWKSISIITDRLKYTIYLDWVHVRWRLIDQWTWVSDVTSVEWSTSLRLKMTSSSASYCTIAPDTAFLCARTKFSIYIQGSQYTWVTINVNKNRLMYDKPTNSFEADSYDSPAVYTNNVGTIEYGNTINWESYIDWFYYSASWTQKKNANMLINFACTSPDWYFMINFYVKEQWDYLYPKDRRIFEIEDEVYMEWIDTTSYDQLYYDPLADRDWNTYYYLETGNSIDFPDWYDIASFARWFDYQYAFVNKWDMWIVYYMTDVHLATWDTWWRFPWTKFINAIMIGNYVYVLAEKRWVRWLYIFSDWDMKLLVWANNKYTEDLDLINWKEIFNFTGFMANWRDKVVCSTKDSVFMWWATKLGNNAGAFILKVDWEITDINTKRWYLDVYYTKDNTTYRQSIQDDVNIRNYESEFSVTYPIQISSHLVEKEPLSLAISYNLPNDNTKLEAYISVNDNYFWSFLTDWEVTPEEWDKYKVSWLSWDYWLNFVEKKWNWLTFYLSGDLPYQSSNTKNLVSEDTEQTIAFTDFNHFKYLWESKKEDPEEIDWKHTYLNLTTKNDLPIVRKAQVKIIWITDNHVTPEIYWIRLLSNQFDK